MISQFSSVAQLCPILRPHGLPHARPPCPLTTPGVYSNSCPLSQWCHPTISFSVVPVFSHLQSFPASRSFLMSQFFTSGGQHIGVSASASVLPRNIQDWFPLGWTDWISLQSKGLSRVWSFHMPLMLLHQREDSLKTTIRGNQPIWPHGPQPCLTQWNYEACSVGPPKMDGSWWRVLMKCGPLEKGMANHFSILALRIPWTVWKARILIVCCC